MVQSLKISRLSESLKVLRTDITIRMVRDSRPYARSEYTVYHGKELVASAPVNAITSQIVDTFMRESRDYVCQDCGSKMSVYG